MSFTETPSWNPREAKRPLTGKGTEAQRVVAIGGLPGG